ncbi:MAG: M23 family metallopeptidase, partial [Acidimicrobiaceae bacterium]|nr:M23 family metallopeptidase [Acidimicrobiaceae bacterium]
MCVREILIRVPGLALAALVLLFVVDLGRVWATEPVLRRPTSAAVLDPFRLPDGPYGSGNRGIEYDTSVGDPIAAAGPGTVVFAGPVAGALHITVDHGGGLKSSYSFVGVLLVKRGDRVETGEQVAVAAQGFHFGTRVDEVYVDPATLLGVRVIRVELVEGSDAERTQQFH